MFLAVAALAGRPAAAQSTGDLDALEARAQEAFVAGRSSDAVPMLEQLAAGRRAGGETAGEARALWRLAAGYRSVGAAPRAIDVSKSAYALATRAGANDVAADTLGQLHQLGVYLPPFPTTKTALDEALRLATLAGNPRSLARVHDLRARWLGDTGALDAAIAEVNAGLQHAAKANDQGQLAGLLAIRSTYLSRKGLLGDALADALRAREAAAKVGPRAEVTSLFALAQSQAHLSNFDESARLWTDVIARYRAIGPPIGVAIALDARCHVWYELGRDDLTLADAQAAIDAFQALSEPPSVALFSRAGMATIRQGRPDEAKRWLDEAERRLRTAPGFERIQTLQQLGTAYLMLRDAHRARGAFETMLEAGRERKSLEDEWKAQIGLGRSALLSGQPEIAVTHLEQAAGLVEKLRTTVPAQELRAAYLARRVEAHEWLVTALMAQSASEAAFNVAERARVRALTDLLAESRAVTPAPRALTRPEIAHRLGEGEALIEYMVGEQQAFGWLLTRTELISFPLPSPKALDTQVRLLLSLVDADDRDGLARLGARLTPALLGPARARLREFRRIIFVPDGVLQRLPFAALPLDASGGGYLVQHVASSTVGSGSLLDLLGRAPSPAARAPLLALASSGGEAGARLTSAAGEIRDARRLLDAKGSGQAITQATETTVKSTPLDRYRVIHIAAHAVVDERMPRDSAILLGPTDQDDGVLRAAEIAAMHFEADLVVLASCRTQVGRILRGEGLLSLARAFTQAGARGVVASLWDVGDADTRVLMRGFYTALRAGRAPDEALRDAQLQSVASGGPLAAPKAWASFQVSGEARHPIFSPKPPDRPVDRTWLWLAAGGLVLIALVVLIRRT